MEYWYISVNNKNTLDLLKCKFDSFLSTYKHQIIHSTFFEANFWKTGTDKMYKPMLYEQQMLSGK